MKSITMFVAGSLALWMMVLTGAMASDTGVGVCVLGQGGSLNDETGPGPYVGVNVGTPTTDPTGVFGFGQGSETGAYDNNEDYEAQCCAETGQTPDCFAPVQ